jgi:hypothetical protein
MTSTDHVLRSFERKVRLLAFFSKAPVVSYFALKKLVQLRYQVFFKHSWFNGSKLTNTERFQDLDEGLAGIPEIDASMLSLDRVGSGITHHGSVIVRGLVPTDDIDRLRRSIQSTYEAHDRFNVDGATKSEWYSPFVPSPQEGVNTAIDRSWFRGSGAELAADSPRGLFNVLSSFQNLGILDIVKGYLEERPALSVRKTSLRRVDADQTETGWHQDGAFLGTDIRSINVWIALSDCGDDAPSMEMVPKRLNEIAPTGTPGALMSWTVSPEVVAEVAGDTPPVHLKFSAGDAIFFDEMNLHRTSSRPHFSKPRYAIEAWFFAPSCYPLDQLPLLV